MARSDAAGRLGPAAQARQGVAVGVGGGGVARVRDQRLLGGADRVGPAAQVVEDVGPARMGVGVAGRRGDGVVQAGQRLPPAEVGSLRTPQVQVVEGLGPAEELIKLNRPGRPTGDVIGQEFEQGQRAFAPPVGNRVGDLPARD